VGVWLVFGMPVGSDRDSGMQFVRQKLAKQYNLRLVFSHDVRDTHGEQLSWNEMPFWVQLFQVLIKAYEPILIIDAKAGNISYMDGTTVTPQIISQRRAFVQNNMREHLSPRIPFVFITTHLDDVIDTVYPSGATHTAEARFIFDACKPAAAMGDAAAVRIVCANDYELFIFPNQTFLGHLKAHPSWTNRRPKVHQSVVFSILVDIMVQSITSKNNN
jgi:hypothetical protein